MTHEHTEESLEVLLEKARRTAAGLAGWELDEHLACAVARRSVAETWGRSSAAEHWQAVALLLEEVRDTRRQVAREVETLTGPPPAITTILSPEELGDDG